MRWLRLAPLALVLLLAGCGGGAGGAGTPSHAVSGFTTKGCADLVVIGVRGQTQDPNRNHGVGQEVLRATTELTRIVQHDARVSVRLESLDYESDPPPDLQSYEQAVQSGGRALDRRLDQLEQRCPDTDTAVIGFSMGADVVHAGLHDRSSGSIRLVGMIADPHRDPVAEYDQLTFGESAPNPGSLGAGPEFGDLAARTLAVCAPGDDVCNHSPGTSRQAVDLVHKHYYEKPEHARLIAQRMARILMR